MLTYSIAPRSQNGYLRLSLKYPRGSSIQEKAHFVRSLTDPHADVDSLPAVIDYQLQGSGRRPGDMIWTSGGTWLLHTDLLAVLQDHTRVNLVSLRSRWGGEVQDGYRTLLGVSLPRGFGQPRSVQPAYSLRVTDECARVVRSLDADLDVIESRCPE